MKRLATLARKALAVEIVIVVRLPWVRRMIDRIDQVNDRIWGSN